ncbi:MAG: hypothetical protein E7K72_22780 [Roseomonas mucosa]|nr:hypothetical protein [Roseomonas mucosa]
MSDQTPSGRQAVAHAVNLEQCSVFMHGTPSEKAMLDAAKYLRSLAAPTAPIFECAARKQGTAGDTPADCDWPACGCDPYADKVISALEESGNLNTPPSAAAGERDTEALAEFLNSECEFADGLTGTSWPQHSHDDGYRGGGGYVRLAPPDVVARRREDAKAILSFLSQRRTAAPSRNP